MTNRDKGSEGNKQGPRGGQQRKACYPGCCHKAPQTRWLMTNGHLLLGVLEAGVPGQGASVVGFCDSPFTGCRLPASPRVIPWRKEGKNALWGPFRKNTDSLHVGSDKTWCLPRAPPPNTTTLGSGFQCVNLGPSQTSSP